MCCRRRALPVPGQELIEPMCGITGNAVKHVGEPGLRIDVVHLGRDNQAVKLYMAAARWPPRSDRANNHDFLLCKSIHNRQAWLFAGSQRGGDRGACWTRHQAAYGRISRVRSEIPSMVYALNLS